MKVTLESTSRIVTLVQNGVEIPARVWEGRSESGIEVTALVVRLTAPKEQNLRRFEDELLACRPPSREFEYFPLRTIV